MTSTEAQPSPPKITIYRGWDDRGKQVWSPFVVKLEARFRFAKIPYEVDVGSTRSAPKGKIPYIEIHRGNGYSSMGDSAVIIKTLLEREVLTDLNAELGSEGKAIDLALRALLEEKLYFYHMYERWTQNYYSMRDHVLQALSYPMRVLVGLLIYRNTVKTLHGQGTGRYSAEQIAAFRREIWESINGLLSASKSKVSDFEKPFWVLGGKGPTEADTALFGFVVSTLISTACPESQKLVRSFPVVVEYASRIHDEYFPDYERWAK